MARRPRLNFPGFIHHVIQRGNNREYILENERARNYLLTLFRQAVVEDGAEIYAYVVMNCYCCPQMSRDRRRMLSKS